MKLFSSKYGLAGIAVVAVVVLGAGWLLFSPLLFDEVVDEAFPGVPTAAALAEMSDEEKARIEEEVMSAAADMPDKEMQDDMPAAGGPVLVAQGQFSDADALHKGSGNAGLYRLDSGSYIVRLEDLNVTNGPDLRLVLAQHPDPGSSADVKVDYFDLGELKGNVGNQNYEIPAEVDIAQYGSVAVWCRAFGVLFSAAPLQQTS